MTHTSRMYPGSTHFHKMALKLIVLLAVSVFCVSSNEMTLANVTRFASGDMFSIIGTDCGPTRCMEASHGTALAALGDGCVCRCRRETPAFREDRHACVNHIDECQMASFGRGATKPLIPFVFLPLKGQIIYPSKEIIFTDVEDAICAVSRAQYLSTSGWVTLRDIVDNDVPFGLYRDEGSTFLQWRGSAVLHARLEGRLVSVHVLCSSATAHLASSCAAFRIAGASNNGLFDVRSIPFQAGEIISTETNTTQKEGLSVLESLAIGVCVLMLMFVYAAGIIFYVHYKKKQKRKQKDAENNISSNSSENGSSMDSRINMSNVMLKTNPLLNFNNMGSDFMNDSGMSDSGTDNTLESSKNNSHSTNNKEVNSNVISAMVHPKRKKPSRPSLRQTSNERLNERLQKRSPSPDAYERAPHSDLSIVDCSLENHYAESRAISPEGEPGDQVIRKKLYFNPVFFENDHLKDPPPAAIEFLYKIREVMSIAKDKMMAKRFIPMLYDIPEEDRHHAVNLGWDIPCARRGRRFSAIGLKHENSRKSMHCGGCPGCNSNDRPKAVALTRSNSCDSCASEEYKQRIVRKWLDDVPLPQQPTTPAPKPAKSIAKVNGTPRVIEAKPKETHPEPVEPMQIEELKVDENTPKKSPISKNEISSPVIETKIANKVTDTNNHIIVTAKTENTATEVKPTISKPIITLVTQPEQTIPLKNASRRVRKKLPPPPPPPGKAPALPASKALAPPPPESPEKAPMPKEVKAKMEAVIKELHGCRRVEPKEIEEIKLETISPINIAPKIVIPVLAADSHYYSDDSVLTNPRKKKILGDEVPMEFDSLERNITRRRRFSLACDPELIYMNELSNKRKSMSNRNNLTSSWLDMTKMVDEPPMAHKSSSINEIFIAQPEPLYDNVLQPGPLTIQIRGSPVENRRNSFEDFDPDTLDRKPKQNSNKRVEKILLKSAGSFKYKSPSPEIDTRKNTSLIDLPNQIGNLRQIYEMKAKSQKEEIQMYKRRGSLQYGGQDLAEFLRVLKTPDLIRHIDGKKEKPPVPPKARRGSDTSSLMFAHSLRESPPDRRRAEERDRFGAYSRAENLNARRSGRRSARTRSRRTDLRKLYRTEDSGYMSTDSNESKCRAKYLLQLRPKNTNVNESNLIQVTRTVNKATIVIESDTDDLESLGDGRSESGGESVETDSVFFGNFDDSKEMLAELDMNSFEPRTKIMQGRHEQIDSGFMGETNIILSGDSDSEHRSVISIMTGKDGRASSASIKNIEESPYLHTIGC